ncbi:MAG: hypothetical protein AAGC79_07790 [Pseudomonadota bacterium]
MHRRLWPIVFLSLAACTAPERPSSGYVWCEFYASRVYFSPVIPSIEPVQGRLCDGFERLVVETWQERDGGVLPDVLAYLTEAEAEERRQWYITSKQRSGLEVVTVDWQP